MGAPKTNLVPFISSLKLRTELAHHRPLHRHRHHGASCFRPVPKSVRRTGGVRAARLSGHGRSGRITADADALSADPFGPRPEAPILYFRVEADRYALCRTTDTGDILDPSLAYRSSRHPTRPAVCEVRRGACRWSSVANTVLNSELGFAVKFTSSAIAPDSPDYVNVFVLPLRLLQLRACDQTCL